MAASEKKAKLRRETEARRSAISAEERRIRSERICRRAEERLRSLEVADRSVLFSYMPFGAEVELTPLLERCWREGVPVAAPLTLPKDRRMQLHLVTGSADLQAGPWGIREPLPSC